MSTLESALLSVIAGHEIDDALSALAAVRARLQAKLLRELAHPSKPSKGF